MVFHQIQTSLSDCLIHHIYSYIPFHELYTSSKTNFNLYIEDYYNFHKNNKRGRFYYNKINNTYVRYLLRNNMFLFVEYLLYSNLVVPFGKIKKYYYGDNKFKTYIDFCIFLTNKYESEQTKQLLIDYKKTHHI